jgi:hypothetical protein
VNIKSLRIIMISLATILAGTACAPQATPTPVDVIGTTAAQLAMVMLTQTAGAATATPIPPTVTLTLPPTETSTAVPPTEEGKRQPTVVITFVPCFTGPDDSYVFISNIDPSIRRSGKQVVEILGTGSEPGWVVIRNPYFNNPCWVRVENMEIGPHIILPDYPVMTPGPKP